MSKIETATIDNVNLDEEELRGIGVVLHQLLGTQLGEAGFPIWENTPQKTSFTIMPASERAKVLIDRIKEYRASKGAEEEVKPAPKPRGRPKKTNNTEVVKEPEELDLQPRAATQEEIAMLQKAVQQLQETQDEIRENQTKMMETFQVMLGMLSIFGQNILGVNTPTVLTVGLQEGSIAMQTLATKGQQEEGEDKA